MAHSHPHAFTHFRPLEREGLALPSRRNLLKAGLAGIAGLSVPSLLRQQARADGSAKRGKSVILLWMTGGPSHIDTLDPKPDRPIENRGPFKVIDTRLAGVRICEHLPILANNLDRFTIIRSVDSAGSNHEPNRVMQSGFRDAEPRENRDAERRPAIGSMVSKIHGPNHPAMPAYATFMRSRSHVAFAGDVGKAHDPFVLNQAAAGLPVTFLGTFMMMTLLGVTLNLVSLMGLIIVLSIDVSLDMFIGARSFQTDICFFVCLVLLPTNRLRQPL